MKNFLTACVLLFSLAGLGQAPTLVKNINPKTLDPNSHSDPAKGNNPDYRDTGIAVNGKLIFPARNFNGVELWKSDGTPNGTALIKDIVSYYNFADASPMFLTKIGSDIYFFTAEWNFNDQRYYEFRLRKYNGTTNQVENDPNINGFDDVHDVVTSGGKLFFIGVKNNGNPQNLTDTSLLMYEPGNYNVGILSSDRPRELKVIDDYIVFDADNGTDGRELWTYDINNNNTSLALDINQNPGGSSDPHDFIGYNGAIYFTADDGNGDGAQLKYLDINNSSSGGIGFGIANTNPHNKIVFADQLYFRTNDSTNGEPTHSIYRYDAANNSVEFAGTDMASNNGAMAIAGGYLFFAASNGTSGNELWQNDGYNTSMVIDANPYDDGNPLDLTVLGDTLIFTANNGNGYQPFFADGTNSGIIQNVQPNYAAPPIKIIGTAGGFAYMYADDGVHGRELWKTDGTDANTSLVKDINYGDYSSIGSNISGMDSLKGKIYFGAYNGTSEGIYSSDGTAAGTSLVAAGSAVGFDYTYYSGDHIKTVGNTIFFDANAYGTTGYELWKTDGTQAGTVLVKDINPGDSWSYPAQMTAFNGMLIFVADNGVSGNELWKSDGTTAGTILVKDINNGVASSDIRNLTVVGNKVFFVAKDGTNGEELWVSDGTTGGTFMLKDINPGTNGSNPQGLKACNGKLYFNAESPVYGTEPWTSDGTIAGTNILKDIRPGTESSGAADFAPLGSYVYFGADSSGTGKSLWRTDGTAAGTQFFHPVGSPFLMTNIGNKISFICFPGNLGPVHGFEMWATDGTYAGTKKLTDFGAAGVGYFFLTDFPAFKNHWFVYADDNVHGLELWQTDGTPTGTFLNDIAPGVPSSYPTTIKPANHLYFAANDGSDNGYELWKLNVSASVTWLSFTATKQDSSHALLQWATASETGNAGFVIEHSYDNISFDSAGFVAAASPNGTTYSFVDTLRSGYNYYRLRQIDIANNKNYSNTETIFKVAPLKGGVIKGSQTICPGITPSLMTDSIPASGGNGTYTFQWQDSTLASNAWININGATAVSYQAPALTTTKYYRRKVNSGTDSAFSNVLFKMLPVVPDTTLAVDTAWRGYVYNGTDIGLSPASDQFTGYYTDTTTNINTQNQWTAFGSPSLAANYIGCPTAGGDNFTVVFKRKGFTPGNYILVNTNHDDNIRVFANRVQMFDRPNAAYEPIISLGAITDTSVIEIRLTENSGLAYLLFTLQQSNLQPGSIGYDQTICNSTAPNQLGSSSNGAAYGGPKPLQINYQWQDSTAGGNWQNISGATNIFYIPSNLTVTHYYRRAAGDGVSSIVYTNIITVTVLPPVTETPVITKTGRVLSVNLINNLQGIKWFRNGSLISGATMTTYTATLAGTYTARYTFYCGDGPLSNTVTFATDGINQTINFPGINNIAYSPGGFVRLQASASSGLPIRYQVINGNATVSGDSLFISGTGTYVIEASQPGNDNYLPAQPVNQNFTVTVAAQTISFAAIPNKKYGDAAFQLTASSSSGLFVYFTIVSGPAYITGLNTVNISGAGTVTVKAYQPGNDNYAAAPDTNQSFCVGIASLGTITGATTVCPQTFKYAVPKITGAIYEWGVDGGGILTANADSATVQWQTAGVHTLSVKAYSSCDPVRSAASTLDVTVQAVVVPGPVSNMLPANGAQNQQLPLTLSWIPGSNNIRYDLYVWDSAAAQPATPYAAGLTSVSYTLPNSGFPYNRAYKWRIVSYSGCSSISGPVQTFRLIPLPDLVVSNIQVPATAFSAQPISVTWRVSNIGPGRTTLNQRWNDAVFLSFDSVPNFNIPPNTNPAAWSQLDFPVRPLLLGTKQNVSALDSGQVYTNTFNFTLPPHYNFPLYVYVITNYAPDAAAPQEMTLVNDTAHAPQPIAVTLSPAPDLRVDSLVTPATTFSGSTINIKYKVRNYGAITLPNNLWYDKVYLSTSPLFNINNATLLKAPKYNNTYYYNAQDAAIYNGTQLQPDSSVTHIASVVIPNFIYGNYFIYVVTDADNTVYEGSLENNNSANSAVQIFLTPTPNLTVSALTLPGNTLSTSQPIGVNWTTLNTGSYDNLQKNQGHYVKVLQACNTCYQPPCAFYINNDGTQGVYCPPPQPGYRIADSLDFGSSRWNDKVYLSRDSTGLDVNNAIFLGVSQQGGYAPYGNLNPENFDNPNVYNIPFLAYLGSGLPAIINPQTAGVNTGNVIKNGSTHPGTLSFSLPNNLAQGNYYVYVYANADKAVFEFPAQMQVKRSNVFTVNRPDLTVPTVTVPATANSGQAISLAYTIQNSGPGSVFNQYRKDYIYISTSPVFDAAAVLIASPEFTENIPANAQVQHQINYTIPPSVSGTRYFYVFTNKDSSFKENSYINNISSVQASISITLTPPPNLSVSNISAPDTVYAVTNFLFKYTVPNNGTTTTNGSWTDSIFVSCSATYNSATAYYIGRRGHNDAIAPGSSYTDSFSLQIPFTFNINNCFAQQNAPAYFFVKTNADNGLFEANSNDNILGTGQKIVINPFVDLIVTSVSGAATATAGRPYSITWADKNIGYNPGYNYFNSWYDAFYFSTDTVLSANDVIGGNYYVNTPLNTNQSITTTNNSLITPNIPAGDYYILVNANAYNQIVAERNLSNNVNILRNAGGTPQKVTVTVPLQPDLRDTILSAPVSVATGQSLPVVHRVTNYGVGVTYPSTWSDAVWLSSDFIPGNAGDIYLGAFNHSGALQPGTSYTDSLNLPIGINVPQGNYVLIIQTNNNGNVFETNTANNLGFKYVTVYRPAPSDLIVSNIIHPDTVLLGYPDTTVWTVQNISANNANGVETDGIYISKNNVLDSTATLLGVKVNTLDLSPLQKDTVTAAPLVQGVTEGAYYVMVKTDILNNIVETEKNNNTGLSATRIYIKVKQLPLGVQLSDQLPNTSRYYKLIIPDSLRGATILLTLKSTDSLAANNRLYVGLGYIPSASGFDYAFGTPNYGNQEILMPSVADSVYYITVNNANNRPVQNITLLAVRLPFAIVRTQSNQGGNTGNVTTKITGSLFSNNMTATLKRGNTIITASAVYYVNSTVAYATFNLQGATLGQYDLILTKPDTSTAVLAQGFAVVQPNNGGLITGTGINTGQTGTGNAPGCAPNSPSGLNAQLQTEVVAPPKVFAGWPFTIQIHYSNPTNVDIPVQTRVLYSLDGLPLSLTQANVDNGTTSLYIEFSEPGGPPNIIRAGGSGTINVYSKAPANYPGHKLGHYILK